MKQVCMDVANRFEVNIKHEEYIYVKIGENVYLLLTSANGVCWSRSHFPKNHDLKWLTELMESLSLAAVKQSHRLNGSHHRPEVYP